MSIVIGALSSVQECLEPEGRNISTGKHPRACRDLLASIVSHENWCEKKAPSLTSSDTAVKEMLAHMKVYLMDTWRSIFANAKHCQGTHCSGMRRTMERMEDMPAIELIATV